MCRPRLRRPVIPPQCELLRTAVYDAEANRVMVTVDGLTGNVRTLFRSEGDLWAVVRGAQWSSAMVLYDYEAPVGITSSYRLMAYRELDEIWYQAKSHSNELRVTPRLTGTLLKAS